MEISIKRPNRFVESIKAAYKKHHLVPMRKVFFKVQVVLDRRGNPDGNQYCACALGAGAIERFGADPTTTNNFSVNVFVLGWIRNDRWRIGFTEGFDDWGVPKELVDESIRRMLLNNKAFAAGYRLGMRAAEEIFRSEVGRVSN